MRGSGGRHRLVLDNFTTLIGGSELLADILLAVIALFFVAGLVVARVTRQSRADVGQRRELTPHDLSSTMFEIPAVHAAMLVGAVGGAVVPMWRAHGTDCRVRIAHGAMAVSMVAMMIPGVPAGIHLLEGAVLIALAVFVTGETMHRRTAVPCAVDLTAMGVLLLLAPDVRSRLDASRRHPRATTTVAQGSRRAGSLSLCSCAGHC